MATLNVPQARFLNLPHKFKAYVAGFGSGKTWAGCSGLCKHSWENPKVNAGYFAPTYPQIKDIFYETMEEVAFDWQLRTKIHQSDKEVSLYSGRQYRTTIKCRSLEKPETIVGFKIGHALVDELDVLKAEKAEKAWRKIIARMRDNTEGLRNGIDVTTTPEGFKFVYNQFYKQVLDNPELAEMYGLVQASTYDNEANLPSDYIPSLLLSYPQALIDAYLRGKFCNLAAGSVYPNFDRKANHTDAIIEDHEALHVGMDFNVLKMAAVINVIRDNEPYALSELSDVRDTPTMARMLSDRFEGRSIVIYPDASGQNTSSKNASESDLSILRQAGFKIAVNGSNPRVKDRVNAMNAQILNGENKRKLRVNTNNCPRLTEFLEQQAYDKNGEPDKTAGHDHMNDAQGYFITQKWPVRKRTLQKLQVKGL